MISLLGAVCSLALQPALSPDFPWPLPDRLQGPQQSAKPLYGRPEGPRVPWYPESLDYDVSWGIIHAGTATLSVREVDLLEEPAGPFPRPDEVRTAYHVVSTARSAKLLGALYWVRDLNESWIDTHALHSVAFSKTLREGTFFRDEWIRYYPAQHRFVSQRKDKQGKISLRQGAMPAEVQDILSALYYVRTRPLVVGQDIVVDVNTVENWPLVVHVLGRERVKVPAGEFDCYLIQPALRAEGIFIQKGHDLKVWLTADDQRVPVRMEVEVFFGHVAAKLAKVSRS